MLPPEMAGALVRVRGHFDSKVKEFLSMFALSVLLLVSASGTDEY